MDKGTKCTSIRHIIIVHQPEVSDGLFLLVVALIRGSSNQCAVNIQKAFNIDLHDEGWNIDFIHALLHKLFGKLLSKMHVLLYIKLDVFKTKA